uniref:Uncharacterized protein n=1 Tax=Micrurus surinamensis TaxID=129470 RepID=A0A2D4NNA3_MICSU
MMCPVPDCILPSVSLPPPAVGAITARQVGFATPECTGQRARGLRRLLDNIDHGHMPSVVLVTTSPQGLIILIGTYFWDRAYITSILKNHARTYFWGNMVRMLK